MSTAHYQKLPQANKFMIGSVPEPGHDSITVEAQYNPKELQIESPIQWTEHKVIGAQSFATKPMEFTAMGAETLKVELLFDAFEENSDYVVNAIAALKTLASVREPYASKKNGNKQRPSYCVATWGTQQPFRCVIESLSVKYTMFAFDGTPVRATVVIALKSGTRELDTEETPFEKATRERANKYQQQRADREAARSRDEHERERRYEEQRTQTASDRRLEEREERARIERQQIEAVRAQRAREADMREQRIARERSIDEQERALASERQRESAAREQRKKSFDLE